MNVCKKKYMIMLLASGGIGVIKAPESPFNAGPPMAESPFGATTNTFRPESNSVAPQQVNSEFAATQRESFQEPMPQNKTQSEPVESRSYEPTNSFEPRPYEQPSEHVFGNNFSGNSQEREESSRSVMSGSYDHHDSHEHQDNQFHPEHVMSEPSKVAPSSVNKPKQIDNKQEDAEEKMVGATVDTFDTDGSGNWVLKRVWWEKIESVYEEIKKVFNDILNARMEFVSQRNSLDREMDVFYGQVGLEEGQLESIISQGLAFLQKSKTDQNFLTAKDEEFSKLIQGKDRDFEQIKLDMEALKELDQKIDEALDTLFQQIDIANKYEQKAWENFKAIARELDDKVARKMYYETETLLKDIKNIESYITEAFSDYFKQTAQSLQTHSKSITAQIHMLKQQGVDLKKQLEELEQARVTNPDEERQKKIIQKQKKEDLKKEEVKPVGFFEVIVDSVVYGYNVFFDTIAGFFSSIGSTVKGFFVKEEPVAIVKKGAKKNQKEPLDQVNSESRKKEEK